jgi:dynein heavy chain
MDLTDLVRKPLTPLARLTLGALIVIDVHARDVVMQLINEKVPTLLHQIATIIPQFFV